MLNHIFTTALVLTMLTGPIRAAEPERPRAGSKPRLAVLGFTAEGMDEQLLLALADVVSVEAEAASAMEVATAADTRAFLTLSEQKQLLGCTEQQCLGQFAGLVDAQRLISGSVTRVSDKYVVSMQLIDVVNGRVMERVTQECTATPEALMATVRKAVPGLFGVVSTITLWNQPEQATVYLDGRLIGRTPVGIVPVRTGGTHKVEVLGPTITPWAAELEVAPGAELRLRAANRSFSELESEATSRRYWGYGLLGGGLAALIAGGGLYTGALSSDARLDDMDRRVASQAELDGITSTTRAYFFTSLTAAVIGAAITGIGTWLLMDNPAEQQLREGGAL